MVANKITSDMFHITIGLDVAFSFGFGIGAKGGMHITIDFSDIHDINLSMLYEAGISFKIGAGQINKLIQLTACQN